MFLFVGKLFSCSIYSTCLIFELGPEKSYGNRQVSFKMKQNKLGPSKMSLTSPHSLNRDLDWKHILKLIVFIIMLKPILFIFQPWCGIPPLRKEFRKPISKKQTRSHQPYSQTRSSGARSPTLFYDESRSIVTRVESLPHTSSERKARAKQMEEMWAEENWDEEKPTTPTPIEDTNKSPVPGKSEEDTLQIHSDPIENRDDDDASNTQSTGEKADSPPNQTDNSGKSEVINKCEEKTQTNEDSTSTNKLERNHLHPEKSKNDEVSKPLDQENGFYDASGIWYPSSKIILSQFSKCFDYKFYQGLSVS